MTTAVLDAISKEFNQLALTISIALEYFPDLGYKTAQSETQHRHSNGCITEYWVMWEDGAGAWVKADGSEVKILIDPEYKNMDSDAFQLGFPGLLAGMCLNLQGQVAIHANAVSLDRASDDLRDQSAIALIGDSGMGKSTLTAYCVSRGAGFITDDILHVDAQTRVTPTHPRLKLYQETGAQLGLVALHTNRYKAFYDPLCIGTHHQQPVAISTLYLLDRSPDHRITIELLSPSHALFELLHHSYLDRQFIIDRPELLDAYLQLVSRVPVKKLIYPRDFNALPDVYNQLLKDQ